jgi:ATP-dependent DNA helicase RecG
MNRDLLNLYLSENEGFTLEYKEGVSKGLDSELVAFANCRGGKVLFGVSDDGKIVGVKDINKLKTQVQDIARNCDPEVVIHFSEIDNVIVGNIPEGKDKPYQCKTGFYIRTGPNTQKLKRDEVISFIQNEGHIRWDEQAYSVFPSVQVYDKSLFLAYAKKAGLSTTLPDVHTLYNLHCALLSEELQLTNTGYLFFGKLPEVAMTYTGITCALFKGTGKHHVIDRKDFQEDILSNIENAMVFLKRVINIRYELPYGELQRKDIPEIPYEALREAIINAVTHRDYSNAGACTMVEVFDDRVEISNPGGLPPSLKPEEFGIKSVTRNPVIAEMMLRIGHIEKMGTGIKKMRDLCYDAGNEAPEFSFTGFFTVTFVKQRWTDEEGSEKTTRKLPNEDETGEKTGEKTTPKTAQIQAFSGSGKNTQPELGDRLGDRLGENRQMILRKMIDNPTISIPVLSAEMGISTTAVEKNIGYLKERGYLKRIGSAKGGHWEVVE